MIIIIGIGILISVIICIAIGGADTGKSKIEFKTANKSLKK